MREPNLQKLSNEQLATLLRNVVRLLDDRKFSAQARGLTPKIQQEFARRQIKPNQEFVPVLAACGYNVRWHDWSKSERQRLLTEIIDQELPFSEFSPDLGAWGRPGSVERARAVYRMIKLYRERYGGLEGRELAQGRWADDMIFIEDLASRRFKNTDRTIYLQSAL